MEILDFTHPPGLRPVNLLTGSACGFQVGNETSLLQEYAGDEVMIANIKRNVQRDLNEFQPSYIVHDGQAVIVGMGPSVAGFVDEIKLHKEAGRPIIAVKGAHDWLIDKGIVPDIATSMESQARSIKFFSKKNENVCYLLASKVHPDVFDFLSDMQVVMWDAWFGDETDKLYKKDQCAVGGGSTSGLRTITLAWLMGFRKIWLYGFDSCIQNGAMRVDGSPAQQWGMEIQAGPTGKVRYCDAQLISQAAEFQEMTFGIMAGLKLNVRGDGLIADIMEERKRLGNKDGF